MQFCLSKGPASRLRLTRCIRWVNHGPLPPVAKRLGCSTLAQEDPRLATWSVFSPATESVLMRSPPHRFGPKVDDIRVRLTFCGVTGQLLERCYAPLEFMEFTEPTDALTVFLHVDLGKASALAELQLAEVGYDLQGQKRGPNRVMEGRLVDLTRGSSPGDCNPEFHYRLIENEERTTRCQRRATTRPIVLISRPAILERGRVFWSI